MAGPGQARFYSSTFVQTSLASGISSGATSFNVLSTTGAPGTPFIVSVDQNTSSEELMLVQNVSGLSYATVTRGVGGTSAVSHNNGAPVVHVMYAQDLTDASAHIGAYDAVHGLSSGSLVVGTTDAQTLTNKTLTSPVINTPTISSPTITGTVSISTMTASGLITASDFKATGLTGAVAASRYVGATSGGAPGSGTFAQGDYVVDNTNGLILVCTTAGSPGTWAALVNLATAQTLSNKTLASPVLTGAATGSATLTLSAAMQGTQFIAVPGTIAGNLAGVSIIGGTTGGAPNSGSWQAGNYAVDYVTPALWVCTTSGSPGTWQPAGLGNILASPINTGSAGTATVGTTDTMDTVLGTYQFTAVTGRRYRVVMANLFGNGSVAGDVFAVRIRDSGSASTPTTASPAVVDNAWTPMAAGTTGRSAIPMVETFVASSSGTHTLAFFAQRSTGTGVFTPVSPATFGGTMTGVRKLWVEDDGNV